MAGSESTIVGPWVEVTDPSTGRVFYTNPLTGQFSNKLPDSVKNQIENVVWWEIYDAESKRPYYFNTATSLTSWARPPGVVPERQESETASASATNAAEMQNLRKGIAAAEALNSARSSRASDAAGTHLKAGKKKKGHSRRRSKGHIEDEGNEEYHSLSLFASRFFVNQKKGLFKKQVSVTDQIMFTKTPIAAALLKLPKDSLNKEAVAIFKLVMCYMGDRTSSESPLLLAQQILEKAVAHPDLKDEIYCQLCKQSCTNPRPESMYKAWELVVMCLHQFPPGKDLDFCLKGHFQERVTNGAGKEPSYAAFAIKRLEKINGTGMRQKVPTLKELERMNEAPFVKSTFGGSLQDVMELQREKYPSAKLPMVLTSLAEAVQKLNGFSTMGIFRVPADADATLHLQKQIEGGNFLVGVRDPHIPANVLKVWLRELSEPLIPPSSYDLCIAAADSSTQAIAVVEKLPALNKEILKYIISFLKNLVKPENQPKTKMGVPNVALLFAACIMRCPSSNPAEILENSKHEQTFVKSLIEGM
eukprot:TRINITY_DN1668_c0_g1_i1.p1 TRINITY_DN1668_c0_g1~~TRINITY_DN1668_c0_g1_i1.p1  ORF type:complete len:571 (+),score=117.45 TRINITY_DN1668_c0_g1_i1:120-1715(+)